MGCARLAPVTLSHLNGVQFMTILCRTCVSDGATNHQLLAYWYYVPRVVKFGPCVDAQAARHAHKNRLETAQIALAAPLVPVR